MPKGKIETLYKTEHGLVAEVLKLARTQAMDLDALSHAIADRFEAFREQGIVAFDKAAFLKACGVGKKKKPKRPSRTDQWAEACGAAKDGLADLISLQEEYNEWKGNLPENLENSPVGEKLQAIENLDLQSALDTVEEAEGLDLPRGFGRD